MYEKFAARQRIESCAQKIPSALRAAFSKPTQKYSTKNSYSFGFNGYLELGDLAFGNGSPGRGHRSGGLSLLHSQASVGAVAGVSTEEPGREL
ncbi:hypothetical protein SUGI_0562740 [Cryptomeria japonica]|nr:hypothetical protein SUGI_0562740 [Cryptomeria japonica]